MTLEERLAGALPAGVRLRHETEADIAFVDSLYASTRTEELAQVPWTEAAKTAFLHSQSALQRSHYRTHYAGAAFLIIEQEGAPIGRVYVYTSAGEYRLMDIALVPEARGRGLGTSLVGALIEDARHTGRIVRLYVEGNNPAQRLYRRLGLRKVGEQGIYHLLEWPRRAERGKTMLP